MYPIQSQINEAVGKILIDVIDYANRFVGTKEVIAPNRGPEIDKIQSFYGKIGLPYCALFTQYVYDYILTRKYKLSQLFPGTPSSQTLFEFCKQKGCVYTDKSLIKPSDIVIWRKYKLWQGHAGLIEWVDLELEKIGTIEGNTVMYKGTDIEGDGIWKKTRTIKKIDFSVDAFWIRGFIDVKKLIILTYGDKLKGVIL